MLIIGSHQHPKKLRRAARRSSAFSMGGVVRRIVELLRQGLHRLQTTVELESSFQTAATSASFFAWIIAAIRTRVDTGDDFGIAHPPQVWAAP